MKKAVFCLVLVTLATISVVSVAEPIEPDGYTVDSEEILTPAGHIHEIILAPADRPADNGTQPPTAADPAQLPQTASTHTGCNVTIKQYFGSRTARRNPGRCRNGGVRVVEKPVIIKTPVNSYNKTNITFTAPPGDPKPERPPTKEEIQERRDSAMLGWIVLIIAIVAATIAGIVAITGSNGVRNQEQRTRQAQANQLATALTNQVPYVPAAGRKVSISANIFPDGGGLVRAESNEQPQAPVIHAVAPPVQALLVTAPGAVQVVHVGNQPPQAQPGQLVAPSAPAPPPPAPAPPPAPPTPPQPTPPPINPVAAAQAGAATP